MRTRLGLGLGVGVDSGVRVTRGPELAPASFTSWVPQGTGAPTVDATGITFTNAPTSAFANVSGIATEDNVTYEVTVTIADYTLGDVQFRVYGATATHTGVSAQLTATTTFQVTTNAAGSPTLQLRITSSAASTSLKITGVSVKKVLG